MRRMPDSLTLPPSIYSLGWSSTKSKGDDDEEAAHPDLGIMIRVLRDAGQVTVYWPVDGKEVQHRVDHPPEAPAELIFAEYRPHPAAHT